MGTLFKLMYASVMANQHCDTENVVSSACRDNLACQRDSPINANLPVIDAKGETKTLRVIWCKKNC